MFTQQMIRTAPLGLLAGCALLALAGTPAQAQQITGTPGSPSATTTIDGKQLPPPDPKFGGVIKDGALQSKPWWAPRVVPPKGAPNVLLIITDDAGFGVPSTFGGVIPTPTMDRIAQEGLRYNRVFSTALCSPTRAALITGRNHHSTGFGVISEASTGFPGYNSIIGKDKATIGRILLDNGYGTSWFGKDHNTPAFAASQVGPFDTWADTTTPHGRLMLTVLGGLAEFERELIRARTDDGRRRAKARGVRFGRPLKLTAHQRREAIQRLAEGAVQADLARTYGVSQATISRLAAPSPFEHGAAATL